MSCFVYAINRAIGFMQHGCCELTTRNRTIATMKTREKAEERRRIEDEERKTTLEAGGENAIAFVDIEKWRKQRSRKRYHPLREAEERGLEHIAVPKIPE